MKRSPFYINVKLSLSIAALLIILYSCEKGLKQEVFDQFSTSTFFKNADDAKAAVAAKYSPMLWYLYLPDNNLELSSFTTDELVTSIDARYQRLYDINFSEDMGLLTSTYLGIMPIITGITINIDKISPIVMDEDLKKQYIAELKGLRAIYSQHLFNLYGAVTIPVDPKKAADPKAEFVPRPTTAETVTQIETDYKDAAAVLPARFTGDDYGRISSTACLTGLMQLYMHEKRWNDAITVGNQIKGMGYALMADYDDNFTINNHGGNSELILAIPARPDGVSNVWLAFALTSDYVDPSGQRLESWGISKMPWTTFDKFDPADKRAKRLLGKFPTYGGQIFDARANGYIGALPMKYGLDPAALGAHSGVDVVVWRYADVLLLLSEAINETQGPNAEAYSLVKDIRTRAGLNEWPAGLTKDQFRNKLMDERLFELWCEGSRRNDMIRWGTFLQRAIDNGSIYAKPEFVLCPLPRQVINESGGIVKQNPGY